MGENSAISQIPKIRVKRTKTFLFMFPMLGDTINDFIDAETRELRKEKLVETPLVNAYVGDVDMPEYNNHIFVLYKFFKSKSYGYLVENLQKHPFFVKMYSPSPQHDMFIFKVSDDFKLEYDLFKSEKPRIYRRFSEVYKKHILKFLDPLIDSKTIETILYSHESRFKELEKELSSSGSKVVIPRDIDNYPIPVILEETFNKQLHL